MILCAPFSERGQSLKRGPRGAPFPWWFCPLWREKNKHMGRERSPSALLLALDVVSYRAALNCMLDAATENILHVASKPMNQP